MIETEYLKHQLKYQWMKAKFWFCEFFGRIYKADVCGHPTRLVQRFIIFDQEEIIEVLDKKDIPYCLACVAGMSILCANPHCSRPILIGNFIRLFCKTPSTPEYAIPYDKDPNCVVGCSVCADTVAEIIGRWVVPGRVQLKNSKTLAVKPTPPAYSQTKSIGQCKNGQV